MSKVIKDLIRKTETGKTDPAVQYQTIIGHNQRYLDKPVTEMTVDEIIAASDGWRKRFKTTSGAAGAYQIIKPTLIQLKQDLGLSGSEKFTPAMQDRMGDALLEKRGLKQFIAGALSTIAFGNNLAREWASFPVLTPTARGKVKLKRGQSYYDSVAGNHALITPAVVERVLELALVEAHGPSPVAAPEPAPIPASPPAYDERDEPQTGVAAGILIFIAIVVAVLLAIWYFSSLR